MNKSAEKGCCSLNENCKFHAEHPPPRAECMGVATVLFLATFHVKYDETNSDLRPVNKAKLRNRFRVFDAINIVIIEDLFVEGYYEDC